MKNEKREYVAPEMKTVKLKQQNSLLQAYSHEAGSLFPHEQDRIA